MKYIDYATFVKLYGEAKESSNLDLFIAERGWQDWMNSFGPSGIFKIMEGIFFLSKSSLAEIRKKYGYSRVGLSRKYYIPARTLQGWDDGSRTAPEYVTLMLYYTLFLDAVNKEDENGTEK